MTFYKGCQIYGIIDGLAWFLSISTLAIKAIERYSMIKNPLHRMKKMSIISKIPHFKANSLS